MKRKVIAIVIVVAIIINATYPIREAEATVPVLAVEAIPYVVTALAACGMVITTSDAYQKVATAFWQQTSDIIRDKINSCINTGYVALQSGWEDVKQYVQTSETTLSNGGTISINGDSCEAEITSNAGAQVQTELITIDGTIQEAVLKWELYTENCVLRVYEDGEASKFWIGKTWDSWYQKYSLYYSTSLSGGRIMTLSDYVGPGELRAKREGTQIKYYYNGTLVKTIDATIQTTSQVSMQILSNAFTDLTSKTQGNIATTQKLDGNNITFQTENVIVTEDKKVAIKGTTPDSYVNVPTADYVAVPNVPPTMSATSTENSISLDWHVIYTAETYDVYINDILNKQGLQTNSCIINGLSPGTTYKIEVKGISATGVIGNYLEYVTTKAASTSDTTSIIDSITGVKTTIQKFFDFNQTINMEPLKIAGQELTNKFPFSLPWDMLRSIQAIEVTGSQPDLNIVVPNTNILKGMSFNVDLSMFQDIINVTRKFEIIIFDIGLILLTRRLLGGDV